MFPCTCTRSVDGRRHWLLAAAAWPAWAWTGTLHAQSKPVLVIGWLDTQSAEGGRPMVGAFNEGMAALGWRLGTQYHVEERHAEGRMERLPALAQELAALKPVVIVALPSGAVRAAAQAAPTTAVVRVLGDSPLAGLVQSLARPGGMVTGLSSVVDEANEKLIEMLAETLPRLRRVGFLSDSTTAGRADHMRYVQRASERFNFEAVVADMAGPQDIEPAMAKLVKAQVQALVILPSGWFSALWPKIMALAQAQRWPVVGGTSARSGSLYGYGPNSLALARRSAHFVDRILKGSKPGDLPIEQPTVFDLVINMKTAGRLGITIPASIRVRATEVIE